MKKSFISVLMLVTLLVQPVMAFRRTEMPEGYLKHFALQNRADIRQNLQDLKKNLKARGIRIVDGVVTAKGTTSLTVTKDGKTYTVNTDANTKFRRHFWGKSSFAEISVGDHVNVWGMFTDDAQTTILAQMIRDTSIQKRFGVFFGTIKSKGTDSFVLTAIKRGDQSVTTDVNTKYINRKQETMNFSQLNVGDRVRVRGLWDKTLNTITEVKQVKDFSLPSQPTKTP